MLRLGLAICLSLAAFNSVAVADDIDAKSAIDRVLVFPSGAEIVRISKVKLPKGDHHLIFSELPARVVSGSVRVEGRATGTLRIGSVDSRRLFVPRDDAEEAASERRRIEKEIERLGDEKSSLLGDIESAETQGQLVANLANLPNRPAPAPTIGAPATGEDWPQVLAFIGVSMAEVKRTILQAKVKIRETDREIKELKKKLSELAPRKKERTEVKVFVSAETPVEADIIVRYQVPNASWSPLYDGRLTTGDKTKPAHLKLVRRARITQRSGEKWENVEVTLSTTRPTAGTAAPKLRTMVVDFLPDRPPPRPMAAPQPLESRAMEESEADGAVGRAFKDRRRVARAPAKAAIKQKAAVVTAPFQALFKVPGRVSVASTGEAKQLIIEETAFEPSLHVRTVPKRDAKAYLYAKLKVPRGAPLLAGPVSLFRDGTYVGSGRLPLLVGDEEHELGFGVDDLVRVRYRVVDQKRGETGLISTSATDNRSYIITVKNLHVRNIRYTVLDHIPVAKNEEIKVEVTGATSPTKLDVDDKKGIIAWEGDLAPDAEKSIRFGYRVSWPSAKKIRYSTR